MPTPDKIFLELLNDIESKLPLRRHELAELETNEPPPPKAGVFSSMFRSPTREQIAAEKARADRQNAREKLKPERLQLLRETVEHLTKYCDLGNEQLPISHPETLEQVETALAQLREKMISHLPQRPFGKEFGALCEWEQYRQIDLSGAENVYVYKLAIEYRSLQHKRQELLPAFLAEVRQWPPSRIKVLLDQRREQVSALPSLFQIRMLHKFTFYSWKFRAYYEDDTFATDPFEDDRQFTKNLISALEDIVWTSPAPLNKTPIDTSPQSITFRLLTPVAEIVSADATRTLFNALLHSHCPPLTFSLVADGTQGEIFQTVTCDVQFAPTLERLVLTYFPSTKLSLETWQQCPPKYDAAAEYRLNYPVGILQRFTDFNPDPMALFCSSVEAVKAGEILILLFELSPAPKELGFDGCQPWLAAVREKKPKPAWAVGIRQLAQAATEQRMEFLLKAGEHFLKQFASHDLSIYRTELERAIREYMKEHENAPLPEHYTMAQQQLAAVPLVEFVRWTPTSERDLLFNLAAYEASRQLAKKGGGRRASDLSTADLAALVIPNFPPHLWKPNYLSTDELASLVHLPHKSVTTPLLQRANMIDQKPPDFVTGPDGLLLGVCNYRRQNIEIRLPQNVRSRHMYALGASGSGKSTLLLNMIKQDIENGTGLAVIDPHGDLIAKILPHIPKHRINDTIFFNAADQDHLIALNPLQARTSKEQEQVRDEFMALFQRLFVSGDAPRMLHILRFVITTLVQSGGTTFFDIRRLLVNSDFRRSVLSTITDPHILEFWEQEFPNFPKGAFDPIVNKLSQFTLSSTVRNILAESKSEVNFYDLMQGRKIFLASLPPDIGEENSHLLGSLIVAQIQMAAMRRSAIAESQRVPFTLYVDEFQNFMSSGFEKILSEARKYQLSLVLAHQYITQLQDNVRAAIFANTHTRLFFQISPQDANTIRTLLGSATPEQLVSFPRGQALVTMPACSPFMLSTFPDPPRPAEDFSEQIIETSRKRYTTRPAAPAEPAAQPAPLPVPDVIPQERPQAAEAAPHQATGPGPASKPEPVPSEPPKPKIKGGKKAPEPNIFDELFNSE